MCDSVCREALGLPCVGSAVAQLLSVRRLWTPHDHQHHTLEIGECFA